MCGIFGYAGVFKKDQLLWNLIKNIAIESETRGTDSTGFSARMQSGIVVTDKMPLKARHFVGMSKRFLSFRKKMPPSFIGHTRLTTSSSPRINNNNHPFIGTEFNMVHNGVVGIWKEYIKEFNLKMRSETDSEVILRLLEQKRQDSTIQHSTQWILENVCGNLAVALLDKVLPAVYLFRNDNPICVHEIPRRLLGGQVHIFTSTQNIFNKAWKKTTGEKNPTKDGVNSFFLEKNMLFSITSYQQKVEGKKWRFVKFPLKVSRPSVHKKTNSKNSSNDIRKPWIIREVSFPKKFWSVPREITNPALGHEITDKDYVAIQDILGKKGGYKELKIDDMSYEEYLRLNAIMATMKNYEREGLRDASKSSEEQLCLPEK